MTHRALIDLSAVDLDDEVIDVDDTMLSNTTPPVRINRSRRSDLSGDEVIRERTPRRQTRQNDIVDLINLSDHEHAIVDLSRGLSPSRDSPFNNVIIASNEISARFPHYHQLMRDTLEATRTLQPMRRLRSRRIGLFTTSLFERTDTRRKTLDQCNASTFLSLLPQERVGTDARELGTCPICLNEYKPRMAVRVMSSACGHKIHKSCFDTWLYKRNIYKCPLDNLPLPFPKLNPDFTDKI